jgi:pyruvate/2-oxoglutarate dehydrogenase complex dihydrolipoamide dehydrogenase (E3) component
MAKYEHVVIGTGSAASAVSLRCRKTGKHVGVTHSRPFDRRCSEAREEHFSKRGIATFHGSARFVAPAAIQVGNDVLEGANVVVAAAETINLFALAIRKGLTSRELIDSAFAYPTLGSDVVYMVEG